MGGEGEGFLNIRDLIFMDGAFESLRGFRVGWPNKYPKFSKRGEG